MNTIFEITKPRFQAGVIVFVEGFLIVDNGCVPRDRCPLPMLRVQKGNVDTGIILEMIGFSGLAVGMKNQTDTSLFLPINVSRGFSVDMLIFAE